MIDNAGTKVQYSILLIIWLDFLWEFYLAIRQHKLCKKTVNVPDGLKNVLTKETFDKARNYALDKSRFSMIKEIFSVILTTTILYKGIFYYFWKMAADMSYWNNEIIHSCIWLLLFNTFSTLTSLPFNIYFTFVIEEKYGFNKQTARFFIIDKIKQFMVGQILFLPVAALAIYIVQNGGDYFFVWLWLMVGVVTLVLLTVYPAYIAPLFDKYTPLPDGELRNSIEKLASQLHFPLAQLYVVEGSKRSAHSNAFFYGLFGEKRIVLFDTLISGGSKQDEILAVLSHELGHWYYNHVNKHIIIMQVNLFLMFACFALMFGYAPLYTALGFPPSHQPVLIGLTAVIQFVLAPYNTLLSFMMVVLSRRFEFQADSFAASLGMTDNLIAALIHLNKDNLGFPVYDSLYSTWHLSHPPLLERMEVLKAIGTKKNK